MEKTTALSLTIIKLYKVSPIYNLLLEVHTRDHLRAGVNEVLFSAKSAAVSQETESALK